MVRRAAHGEGSDEGLGEGLGCSVHLVRLVHPQRHEPLRILCSSVMVGPRPCKKNPKTPNCGAKPRCLRWNGARLLCEGWNGASWVLDQGSASGFGPTEAQTVGWSSVRR